MPNALLRLGLWGVQERSPQRLRQILLVNLGSLGAALTTVCYQVFYLAWGVAPFARIFALNSACLIAYLLSVWLNRQGRHDLARTLMVVTTGLQLCLVDMLVGVGVRLFYFALLLVLPLLYYRRGWRMLTGMGSIVVALFLMAHFGAAQAALPEFVLDIMFIGNVLGAMSMLAILVHLFNTEIVRIERALSRSNAMLQKLSLTDELTGLTNRRSLMQSLPREWAHLRREQAPLTLLMCDVDDFKSYNDHYGHPAGDQVLRKVAEALASAAQRPSDLVARYGGEEFVLLLPDTGETEGRTVADRVLAAVRTLALPHGFSRATPIVTVSIGLACMRSAPDGDFNRLLKAADQALYLAKEQGRNGVAVFVSPIVQDDASV